MLFQCSPHLQTIRERISVGNDGGPVSVGLLRDLFDEAKDTIDESIESENGALTHFEVVCLQLVYLFLSQEISCLICMILFMQTWEPQIFMT